MISKMLDDIANRLEAKGLIKEAYEIDKISNTIEKIAYPYQKKEAMQIMDTLKKYVSQIPSIKDIFNIISGKNPKEAIVELINRIGIPSEQEIDQAVKLKDLLFSKKAFSGTIDAGIFNNFRNIKKTVMTMVLLGLLSSITGKTFAESSNSMKSQFSNFIKQNQEMMSSFSNNAANEMNAFLQQNENEMNSFLHENGDNAGTVTKKESPKPPEVGNKSDPTKEDTSLENTNDKADGGLSDYENKYEKVKKQMEDQENKYKQQREQQTNEARRLTLNGIKYVGSLFQNSTGDNIPDEYQIKTNVNGTQKVYKAINKKQSTILKSFMVLNKEIVNIHEKYHTDFNFRMEVSDLMDKILDQYQKKWPNLVQ